jgi:hypothetical protein
MKTIKYTFGVVSIVLLSTIFTSCGSKGDSSADAEDRFGKMEVVIPDELKDNPEIVEYIESMSEVVDEYALLMDDMIGEMDGIAGKDWDELKISEQLKLTKTAAKFAMKSAPITVKWGELEAKRSITDNDLSEDELVALESVLLRFEKRMEQIEEKNQDFFSDLNG